MGLSPRVRGNREFNGFSYRLTGSIPARAGEPPGQGSACAARWVYPRACGEPRFDDDSGGARQVYPRACGGTTLVIGMALLGAGLSPRVRGTARVVSLATSFKGLSRVYGGTLLENYYR